MTIIFVILGLITFAPIIIPLCIKAHEINRKLEKQFKEKYYNGL